MEIFSSLKKKKLIKMTNKYKLEEKYVGEKNINFFEKIINSGKFQKNIGVNANQFVEDF